MTNIRIHDTLSRTKVEFQPIEKDHVRIYVCGPTVYDYAHVGNARPVVVFDVLGAVGGYREHLGRLEAPGRPAGVRRPVPAACARGRTPPRARSASGRRVRRRSSLRDRQ